VNPSSVNKWVSEGRLRAYRTPGGHRRIRVGDLIAFLDSQHYPVPRPLEHAVRRRLLVVDDDVDQLSAVARLVKPHAERVDVQTVDNGIDALVLIGSWKPHLVILDVYMPELDGLEVCRRLHANPDTREVGVVVASAQMTDEIEKNALDAGARRAVAKPVPLATVLSELMPDERAAI
jgi:excisionase family DNA binding protein